MKRTKDSKKLKARRAAGRKPGSPAPHSRLSPKIRSCIQRQEGLVFLNLDLEKIENEDIDATGIDDIGIATRELANVRIRNFSGTLTLGGSSNWPHCRKLTIQDCVSGRFGLYQSVFVECEFIECEIDELWATDSVFTRCKFTGSIKKGVFTRKPKSAADNFEFEGNDFRECDLGDVSFRLGIDLRKQRFNPVQTRMNIHDAPELLRQLESCVEHGNASSGLLKLSAFLQQSVSLFKQRDVFVSKPFAKAYLCRYLAEVDEDERNRVSPRFTKWAQELQIQCKPA